MTRVCVTWDREETARLVARCRKALAARADRKALVQTGAVAMANVMRLPEWMQRPALGRDMKPVAELVVDALHPHLAAALNEALRTVLDGIAATLGRDYQSRERDVEHALTSLAAIAEALGVQEER